jgi:hypothetical protein
MTVTPLARKAEHTDERAALRQAVLAAAHAKAAVAAHCAAIERARELVAEAQTKLAAARAGGGSPSSAGVIRAARTAERDCEDDIEAAKSALLLLETGLADLESDAAVAGKAVEKVLAVTMEPVVCRLIEEARVQHAQFVMTQAALSALGSLWDSWDPVSKQINRVGVFNDADARLSVASRQKWEAALNAMRENADAPLPD